MHMRYDLIIIGSGSVGAAAGYYATRAGLKVLMIDARNVYHVMSARSHVFTEEQLANLNAIVWLYRGESEKFIALVSRYQQQVDNWLALLPVS